MKRFMRIISLTLAAILCAAALVSCGNKSYTSGNTEYFIGATGPLTGDASVYGIAVQRGAQIAIDEINAAGGLNGVKFKFDMKDDQAGEEAAVNGYTALYEAGMQLSIGSVTSGSCASFNEVAKEDKVVSITPSASAQKVIDISEYAFRVCFSDPQQGEISAQKLTAEFKKIGVIYDTSDTYSSGIYEAFVAEMTKLGKAKDTDYVVRTFDA
ncbi:MAG: ABC transporter substrate-binding protein, partial [Clostridia bacterium]|nr:ABC transporter substrate-binding protein [Clostridia bacterium]